MVQVALKLSDAMCNTVLDENTLISADSSKLDKDVLVYAEIISQPLRKESLK